MDVLELFLDAPAKAAPTGTEAVDNEAELEALAREFKDATTPGEAKEALKAFLKLVNSK